VFRGTFLIVLLHPEHKSQQSPTVERDKRIKIVSFSVRRFVCQYKEYGDHNGGDKAPDVK
jgi:hypothetical protein